MTIGQLRLLIQNLPPQIKVGIVVNEDIIKDMCMTSGVVKMEDFETGEKEIAFLIFPCEDVLIEQEFKVHKNDITLN